VCAAAGSSGGPRAQTRQHAYARIEGLAATCVTEAGVDGCGVSVLDSNGGPLTLLATDPIAASIEDLQVTLGEGPCREASVGGIPVLIPDLRDASEGLSERWPMFASEVSKLGARAMFAFPVRIGAIALGVVDLYRAEPGPLTLEQTSQTFSTMDRFGRHMLDLESEHVDDDDAPYPMAVHQAAGMVMVQLDTTIEDALVRLRGAAYADMRPIDELAKDVLDGRIRFGKEPR
jgi:hypothetical protein